MSSPPWNCGTSWRRSGTEPRGRGAWLALSAAGALSACAAPSPVRDTTGIQTLGRWEWRGHLVVATDPRVTLVRLRIDTSGPAGTDVALARYDFEPDAPAGGSYELDLGLAFGRIRDLRPLTSYTLGSPPARVLAYATVTCVCLPLRPDSVRGTFELATRGMRQVTGRVDATLYFTEWGDPTRHAVYALHQRIDALK